MKPFSCMDIHIIIENRVSIWHFGHLQFCIFIHVNLQLSPVWVLQEGPQRPHQAKDEDL